MATFTPLLYGTFMATVDVFMLGIIKSISTGAIKNIWWMAIPTVVYAIQPWVFLQSLRFETMIVMNLLWDLISDILVTGSGLAYFKEKISPRKMAGVVISLVGMYLMSCEKVNAC
jgi:multidrug transporter EmrE-like cation transporter